MFTPDVHPPRGLRVTVMGLGLFGGGVGVVRYYSRQGARVLVTDLRRSDSLADSVAELSGEAVEFHLGGHRESDFTDADLVVVNPAVPWDNPFVRLARDRGVPLESELNLFFKLCPAPIVGVTGTNGKTTTAHLLGAILDRAARRRGTRAWLGGNMGRSLLLEAEAIRPEDQVVLEISSFQLDNLASLGRGPHGAILTNLRPNHLDRHGTMEQYAAAKASILRFQKPGDFAVLNADDPEFGRWGDRVRGTTAWFSRRSTPARGAWLDGDRLTLVKEGRMVPVLARSEVVLPGAFNVENLLAAFAAAQEMGAEPDEMAAVARAFRGVEHRLQLVCEAGGVRYYNDSIATNPDSTIAALDAVRGRIVWIGGGSDKGIPFDELAAAIADRGLRLAVLVGATAPAIEQALRAVGERCPPISRAAAFDEAVTLAHQAAAPGDAVLLSPACASFDSFRNFAERGRRFTLRVLELTGAGEGHPGPPAGET